MTISTVRETAAMTMSATREPERIAITVSQGPPGPAGPVGPAGPPGDVGPAGPAGVGVPAGGTTGQVLTKTSNSDYATAWAAGGGGLTLPLTQSLTFSPDTTHDIGASGANRPRSIYVGTSVVTPQLKVGDGTAAAPGLNFSSEADLGIFRRGAQTLGVTLGPYRNRIDIQPLFVNLSSQMAFGWSSNSDPGLAVPDTNLVRDAANTLAMRNLANPQIFRVYNTYTDASNYERAEFSWGSNYFTIGTSGAGTGNNNRGLILRSNLGIFFNHSSGTYWQVNSGAGGHFQAGADNACDIGGASANRPRNIYVAGAFVNRTKAGVPVDADFTSPRDGMLAIDTTNHALYARSGGVWRSVALT